MEGWLVEVKMDLAMMAEKVDDIGTYAAGDVIGWQITVSDNDGEAARKWIGNWIPDTQWDHADSLGILKLGSKITGTVDPSGIGKTDSEAKLSIYPNPVAKELHISCESNIEFIEISNAVGALMIRKTRVNERIDVSDLDPGLYFVKVNLDDGLIVTHKFVKE